MPSDFGRRWLTISTLTLFQVALEVWGVVFCILAAICILVMRPSNPEYTTRKFIIELLCIFLLINDCLAWMFRGHSSSLAFYVVRFSNFFVFFTNYIYMSFFGFFLWKSCSEKGTKRPKQLIALYAISVIAIIALIASNFFCLFYYFDGQNTYHRAQYYIFTQLVAMVGMLLCFSILLMYRKKIERLAFYSMLSYFVLPALATIFQAFHYGLSLQNFSVVFSAQLMFAIDVIDLAKQLDSSKSAFQVVSEMAEHDRMTGLLNKPSALSKIEHCLSEMSSNDGASLIFLDIDDFKAVNDTYGHNAGDFWIIKIAQILMHNFRGDDILCRFGGDEYVVFLSDMTDIDILCAKFDAIYAQLLACSKEREQDVYCSIGVYRIFGANHQLLDCIDLADKALYEAKRNGKHTFVIKDIT